MGTLDAASFQPPAVPASTSGPAALVLLNTLGYVADGGNATTAEALTSTGQPIAVSFFRVEPPGVSHFCVHCSGLEDAAYTTEPTVIHSADNLAILTLCLKVGRAHTREYFLYRASRRGQPQSLEPLPGLHEHLSKSMFTPFAPIAIVPSGGDGVHFILAAFEPRSGTCQQYDLHVFRSNLGTWTEKVVELGGAATAMRPDKVIVLGGGEIGWVDLWGGILVCNLLDDDPVFRAIPLPTLLPFNRANTEEYGRRADPFRDVVCVDGVIKLVEIEHCRRRIVHDVSELEVLYDQDLPLGKTVERKDTFEYTGWRLVTWNRTASSNCWRRGSLVHVDDLDMRHSALPPELVRKKNTLKNLPLGYPNLSMDGTDVVYLRCKVRKKAWVVAVDTRKKTIQDAAPFPDQRFRNENYITSGLFRIS